MVWEVVNALPVMQMDLVQLMVDPAAINAIHRCKNKAGWEVDTPGSTGTEQAACDALLYARIAVSVPCLR